MVHLDHKDVRSGLRSGHMTRPEALLIEEGDMVREGRLLERSSAFASFLVKGRILWWKC